MADVFSKEKRSQIMSNVKSRGNSSTELRLVHIFRENGIKGWRRHSGMLGRPDFVFSKARLVVFVDGCFWHNCPHHGSVPATNRPFWVAKLARNAKRDRVVRTSLRKSGWSVLRLWQHDLREPERVLRRISRALARVDS